MPGVIKKSKYEEVNRIESPSNLKIVVNLKISLEKFFIAADNNSKFYPA